MLWALADPTGIPAKQFADMEPAPPPEWLRKLIEEPVSGRPLLDLVDLSRTQPSQAGSHLLRWLCRHLDKPEVFLRVSRCPVPIDGALASTISSALVLDGQNCAPEPIRTAWRLLLSGVVGQRSYVDVFAVRRQLAETGAMLPKRIAVRRALAPCLCVGPLLDPRKDISSGIGAVVDLFRCELAFRTRDLRAVLGAPLLPGAVHGLLPELLPEFHGLVREALDLLRAIGEANSEHDGTDWALPSIAPHGQNKHFPEWVWLIELLRDAWLATLAIAPGRARAYVALWWAEPYPLFKRLALFAAIHRGADPDHRWLGELLADGAYWLWSAETGREVLRALDEVAPGLGVEQLGRLQEALLAGPPARLLASLNLSEERRAVFSERAIWVRVKKLASAGVRLSADAQARLDQLQQRHPGWQLAPDQREEFSHWVTFSFGQGLPVEGVGGELPADPIELAAWLVEDTGAAAGRVVLDGRWGDLCRSDVERAAQALEIAGEGGTWPAHGWSEALNAWSGGMVALSSWNLCWRILHRMPREAMAKIAHALAWWLKSIAGELDPSEPAPEFIAFCRTALSTVRSVPGVHDDFVMAAMNSSVGIIAEAVLQLWFNQKPQRDQLLPDDLRPLFTLVCEDHGLRDARTLLAANALALFRVDPDWFRGSLAPMFDWNLLPNEAAAAWSGLVYTWRVDASLIVEVSSSFVATANHYAELGRWSGRYAKILTWMALEPSASLTTADLCSAFGALPPEGLAEASGVLVEAVDAADTGRAEAWHGRIRPLIRDVWPKPAAHAPTLAAQFARLAIRTGAAFEDAVDTVGPWLCPLGQWSDLFVRELRESGRCAGFPETALELLSRTITDRMPWPNELSDCLNEIGRAGDLASDQRFICLRELAGD